MVFFAFLIGLVVGWTLGGAYTMRQVSPAEKERLFALKNSDLK